MTVTEVESIGSFIGSAFSEPLLQAAFCVRYWPIWFTSISGWRSRHLCCPCRNSSLCRCSRSLAGSPADRRRAPHSVPFTVGPAVRIPFAPAASQERTSHRVTRRNVACQPRAATAWLRAQRASQPSGAPAHAPTRRSAPPRLASKVQWQLRDRLEPRRVVADGRVPAAWGVAADGGPRVRIHLPPAVSSVVEPRAPGRRSPWGV